MCRVVPLRVGFLRVGFLRVGFRVGSLAGSGWQPLPSRAPCRFLFISFLLFLFGLSSEMSGARGACGACRSACTEILKFFPPGEFLSA